MAIGLIFEIGEDEVRKCVDEGMPFKYLSCGRFWRTGSEELASRGLPREVERCKWISSLGQTPPIAKIDAWP